MLRRLLTARLLGLPLGLTLAYAAAQVVAALFGELLALPDGVSLWYPPAALMYLYLSAVGVRGVVPALVVRVAVATLVVGSTMPLWQSALVGLPVVAAYALVAPSVSRFRRTREVLPDTPTVQRFLLLGAVVGPLLAAVGSRLVLLAITGTPVTDLATSALAFAVGDSVAILTIVPGAMVLQGVVTVPRDRVVARRALVTSLGAGGVAVATLVGPFAELGLEFLVLVPVLLLGAWCGFAWFALAQLVLFTTVAVLVGAVLDVPTEVLSTVDLVWWVAAASGILVAVVTEERQHAIRAQVAATRRLDALFENGAIPKVLQDARTGLVVRANAAARELFEAPGRPLVGSTGPGLPPTDDQTPALTPDSATGTVRPIAARLVGADGSELHCDLRIAPLEGLDGTPDLLVVQYVDVTEEHEQRAALERSREQLDAFASRVAHDLRSPLAAISGFAQLLRDNEERLDPTLRRELLERLSAAALRAVDQVEGMRQAARDLRTVPEPISPEALEQWLDGMLALELRDSRGELRVELASDCPPVDGVAVRQVLLNLVHNSIRHGHRDRFPQITVAAEPDSGGVRFEVTDNGPGIAPHDLEAVFVGRRLGPDASGTGSGLSASRAIAERAGGWLQAAEHTPGARFVLWLPALVDVTTPTTGAPTRGDRATGVQATAAPTARPAARPEKMQPPRNVPSRAR